jgi:AraC-like DNA-binding protein
MLHDPSLPGVEVLHAHYVRYRYAPHWHEAICVAVVRTGAAVFDYGRVRHVAPAGSVFVIPAFEVHTGEPADRAGLGYQVLYIRPGQLTDLLDDAGACGPGCLARLPGDVVRHRPAAVGPLHRFHRAMTSPAWPMEREHALLEAMAAVAAEFGAGTVRHRSGVPREHRAVRQARDYLNAHVVEAVTLRDLAQISGLSMYRLARTFKAEVGLAPHAYQIQLRVLRAKQLLATGSRIAEAAEECGFYDQAHLTSQFKRHVGVTPGAYSRGTLARGDGVHDLSPSPLSDAARLTAPPSAGEP